MLSRNVVVHWCEIAVFHCEFEDHTIVATAAIHIISKHFIPAEFILFTDSIFPYHYHHNPHIFLIAHFIWAFSLMFLFSGRAYNPCYFVEIAIVMYHIIIILHSACCILMYNSIIFTSKPTRRGWFAYTQTIYQVIMLFFQRYSCVTKFATRDLTT